MLAAAGCAFADIVSVRVTLSASAAGDGIEAKAVAAWFVEACERSGGLKPALSVVGGASLPHNAAVAIEAVATVV